MARTIQEMREEWAKRWIRDADNSIRAHKLAILELQTYLADEAQRAFVEELIIEREEAIEDIGDKHLTWKRTAKHKWNLEMPDLRP